MILRGCGAYVPFVTPRSLVYQPFCAALIGMSCFSPVWMIGRGRDPVSPARMIPFILICGAAPPVERNPVGVVRKPFLIRIFIIVQLGREIYEQATLISHGLEPMPAVSLNPDCFHITLADDVYIGLTFCRRVLSLGISSNFCSATRDDEVVNLTAVVAMPGPNDTRVCFRYVRHS